MAEDRKEVEGTDEAPLVSSIFGNTSSLWWSNSSVYRNRCHLYCLISNIFHTLEINHLRPDRMTNGPPANDSIIWMIRNQ
jgi:hypothetical protein